MQGSIEDIKDFLPLELDSIKVSSDKCINLAKEVEEKFAGLMKLIGAIKEVSLVAQGSQEDALKNAGTLFLPKTKTTNTKEYTIQNNSKETIPLMPFITEKEKKNIERKQKTLEKEVLEAKEQVKETRENYERATDSYYEAMDKLPTNWKEFGLNVSSNTG